MKIKAGYRITVTSWENDGDNYATRTVDGLNEAVVRYHIDLIKLLSDSPQGGGFGNMYEPMDRELGNFQKEVIKVMKSHGVEFEDPDDLVDLFHEIVCEYMGYSENFYTRVVETIEVEYVPEEIDIEDVGYKFGV